MKIIRNVYNNTIDVKNSINTVKNETFENNTVIYLKKISLLSLLGAIIVFLFNGFNALKYSLFYNTKIETINFINYNFGKAVGMFFAYFIIGTLGLLFFGFIINLFSRERLVLTFNKLYQSLEPIILFGAISYFVPGLIIWSIIRFINISKELKKDLKIKNSIEQRE